MSKALHQAFLVCLREGEVQDALSSSRTWATKSRRQSPSYMHSESQSESVGDDDFDKEPTPRDSPVTGQLCMQHSPYLHSDPQSDCMEDFDRITHNCHIMSASVRAGAPRDDGCSIEDDHVELIYYGEAAKLVYDRPRAPADGKTLAAKM